MSKQKAAKDLTPKDYEQLGRSMESVFENGYFNRWRAFRFNIARGLFFGIGSAIGATLILALLIWFLGLFTEVPFIGDATESIKSTIENTDTAE